MSAINTQGKDSKAEATQEEAMSFDIHFKNQYGVKVEVEYRNMYTENLEARVVMTYPAGCVQTTNWYKVIHLQPNGNTVEYVLLCEMMNRDTKF